MAKKRGNNEGSITRRPDGRWMAQVTIGRDPATGKPQRATFYGKTRQEVADKLTKALRDKQQGTFVAPHKLTLGEWLQTWLWEYKAPRVRPATFAGYEMIVRRHLSPALGHIALQDLRPEHIQRSLNTRLQEGMAPKTICGHRLLLVNALARAEKNGLVARDVCRLVEPPRYTRKDMRVLTMEQMTTRLLPALTGHRLSAVFLTLFLVGLRRGELLGLRWQDVDMKAQVLHIRQTIVRVKDYAIGHTRLVVQEPKTASSRRTILLPEACLTALRQHRARQATERLAYGPGYTDHGLVFCREDGRPLDQRTLNDHFRKAIAEAGLPPLRLHDARHTFATWLLEQGVSPKVVQTMLGHSSIAMTLDTYSHVSLELEKQAAATLNAALHAGLQ
jgi:integrase